MSSIFMEKITFYSTKWLVKQGHSIAPPSVEEVMCDLTVKKCKVLTRFKPATLKVFCIVYFQVPA